MCVYAIRGALRSRGCQAIACFWHQFLKVGGNFLSLFKRFEACFVLRQEETVNSFNPIIKGSNVLLCKKREPASSKASKMKTTRKGLKTLSPAAAKNTPFCFGPAAKQTETFFFEYGALGSAFFFSRAAKTRCATGRAWCGKLHHAFGTSWRKNDVYDKNVRERNTSPPILLSAV